ncbi:MAG TPA: ATP-binding protein, partial [Rudaea sp.]
STSEKEPAELGELIKVATTVARNEWKYVADLAIDVDPQLPPVPCLRDEIGQVIMNLVVNAAHAVGDVVRARGEGKGAITIRARRDGDMAEIRVQDSGTGIPDAIRARVFDPFFTTKPVGRGTGQGLAICYAIVIEKHQGQIFFESVEGKGTTFVVRLPLGAHAPAAVSCA